MNKKTKRVDTADQKRIELHCHTNMSEMDGISDIRDIIDQSAEWGHKAIAITDHGVIQSFPSAFEHLKKIREKYPDFKVIYGLEAYLVDDYAGIIFNEKGQSFEESYVALDIETTGFSSSTDKIIEIGAIKIVNGEITDRFSTYVNPGESIPEKIVQLTSITDQMVADAPLIEEAMSAFLTFCEGSVLVGHNVEFEKSFIEQKARNLNIDIDFTYVDTLKMARAQLDQISEYKLDYVAKVLNIPVQNCQRTVDYAECTALIFLRLVEKLKEKGIYDLNALQKFGSKPVDIIKKSPTYHATILAANVAGKINLYRLVSLSHTTYLGQSPRIPKSVLEKHRKGLIIGSACEQGELYRAIVNKKTDDAILNIASFYDFLEIQPVKNNMWMIDDSRIDAINSEEDLININKKIISIGEKLGKPVVATGDMHFLNPEDEIYRRILYSAQGFKDADLPAPLYFRTTEEMLKEFSYLSEEKAFEVVVKNSNLIADMIDDIEPIRKDWCPPVIDHSDGYLYLECKERACEMYGKNLPRIVEERLTRELDSIIGNGFSVHYRAAMELVRKSMEEGYLVGLRGSVGASFVAYTAGITEVNPLPPHYLCPECKYSDFDSEEVKKYRGYAGYDMPDKECPICGALLNKEGFDLPFEVFQGLDGSKEPDIDLNFSGEIQTTIHKFAEEIFGEGNCFKGGTIITIGQKTAFGYTQDYFKNRGIKKHGAAIERISEGLTGIKRISGQHPGGIIILPKGKDINTFTPIQYPGNKQVGSFFATHFDYHSIDHNLLKIDLLGHDDPTMLKLLQDYSGFNHKEVPFDDPKIMALFKNTDILGISSEQIGGTKLGTLGVPEFGSDSVMDMIVVSQPESFSDLVRLSGLNHGTDTWSENAKELIESKTATLSTCICCREDIMTYLMGKGFDREMSFRIMENVRRGHVHRGKCDKWNEWKKEMVDHGVPEWYVQSCEKIQYMFPKAHLAAYVKMAWRIAYYKVYYPQAFYMAWFSVNTTKNHRKEVLNGFEEIKKSISMFRLRKDLTAWEEHRYYEMRVAEEMYARGIKINPSSIGRKNT